jgi:uncharacterized membrane protein
MLDGVLGLPLHPLVVHAVVVLLPLVAVGVIALTVRPAWRPRLALPLLGLLAVAAVSAIVAMLSGRSLAERVGTPVQHEQLGTLLAVTAVAYLLLAGYWLWWVRRAEKEPTTPQNATGWVASIASVAVVALTIAVGHSGSSAVWADWMVEAPATDPTPAASPSPASSASSSAVSSASSPASTPPSTTTPAPSAAPTSTVASLYSADMLADHATAEDCWAVIDGNMYDLTDWIALHPGGASRIEALCGTDATAAFTGQHDGQPNPAEALSRHLLGPVG